MLIGETLYFTMQSTDDLVEKNQDLRTELSDDPIDQTRFFLTPSADLDNLTPIEALKRGDTYLERVTLKARQFQEQGAK